MTDLISRQDAIEMVKAYVPYKHLNETRESYILDGLEKLPSAQQWIPITVRPAEGDELKSYLYMFTCEMPDDEQEILVTVHSEKHGNWVEKDVNYIDDGFHLDSGFDWQTDVIAWMPLPSAYEENRNDNL